MRFNFNRERFAMKQIVLFAFLILISAVGKAEVFKCKIGEHVVYSESPCDENAAVVKNNSSNPSATEVRAARNRASNDMRQVQQIERKEAAEHQAREVAKPSVVAVIITVQPKVKK
jgi:cytoskeletal protein RodZ